MKKNTGPLYFDRISEFFVDVKLSEHPDRTSLKGINALLSFYAEDSLITGYVASRTSNPYPLTDRVHAVPGSLIDEFI